MSHGLHWQRLKGEHRCDYVRFDANFYKTRSHSFLCNAAANEGSISLFKPANPVEHDLLIAHLVDGEYPVVTHGRERQVTEWKEKVPRSDQDFFDGLAGCLVAASMERVCLSGEEEFYRRPGRIRKRRSFGRGDVETAGRMR